ncbi:hypothetical protein SAMN05192539_1023100 [Paraburkholderia diazotrophica]|uniref:Uncharacterized protein n=1 Tax=Paraburkholderia diazotrophica TaxID=667676 RepID=A0A1H7CXL6_9BURK|nr:hypothetical protein SAMN05192539_1023100 [Paraburkholderia diazotrophica]
MLGDTDAIYIITVTHKGARRTALLEPCVSCSGWSGRSNVLVQIWLNVSCWPDPVRWREWLTLLLCGWILVTSHAPRRLPSPC